MWTQNTKGTLWGTQWMAKINMEKAMRNLNNYEKFVQQVRDVSFCNRVAVSDVH
jgi:hypothetical protein